MDNVIIISLDADNCSGKLGPVDIHFNHKNIEATITKDI